MTMQQVQVNTKFLNTLPPEWSKFMTDVKLARNMHTTNYDQLYAYLSQHEAYVIKVRLMRERFPDPLALIANNPHIPSYLTNHQSQYNPTYYQQQSSLTNDLDAFDLDCDEAPCAKAVLKANLSDYD
ncbi:hypothetical protein Tco_1462819 [Tanacetum coccineum]